MEIQPAVWVHCMGCEEDFAAAKGSVAHREKLCNDCAEHRDRDPEEDPDGR